MFRAGSLTKRLKVTQGISASPKIQIIPDLVVIGTGQTSEVTLTVSNVEQVPYWYWVVTPSGTTEGVDVSDEPNVTPTISTGNAMPLTGNSLTSIFYVKNISALSGTCTLVAQLFTTGSTGHIELSRDVKNIVLTQGQPQDPTITIYYTGGSNMTLQKNVSQQFTVKVSKVNQAISYS